MTESDARCWRSECRTGCYYPTVCSERAARDVSAAAPDAIAESREGVSAGDSASEGLKGAQIGDFVYHYDPTPDERPWWADLDESDVLKMYDADGNHVADATVGKLIPNGYDITFTIGPKGES